MRSLIQENLFEKSLAQKINVGKVHAREFIVDKLNEITDTREFTRGKKSPKNNFDAIEFIVEKLK